MLRRATLLLGFVTLGSLAEAVPLRVGEAERAELEALARRFYESTRDGVRTPAEVFPTREELRALFARADGVTAPRAVADAGAGGGAAMGDAVVTHQLTAIDRDVRALRERFQGGTFRGLAGPAVTERALRQRGCGRFARADAVCADGLMLEYQVGSETRRFRIDTLVRIGRRWRILDVRN